MAARLKIQSNSGEIEQLRARLEHLLAAAPAFGRDDPLGLEETRWLAKAEASLSGVGDPLVMADFRTARAKLHTLTHDAMAVLRPVMTGYYLVEALCPPSAQGVFIPQGDEWGGFAALVSLLSPPRQSVFVIDPYLDAKAYCEVVSVAKADSLRLLTSPAYRDGLDVAHTKRVAAGDDSVQLQYAKRGVLHDRLIILDDVEVWLVSQSLKDIAVRSPASLAKADDVLAKMKVEAYRTLWTNAALPS